MLSPLSLESIKVENDSQDMNINKGDTKYNKSPNTNIAYPIKKPQPKASRLTLIKEKNTPNLRTSTEFKEICNIFETLTQNLSSNKKHITGTNDTKPIFTTLEVIHTKNCHI